MKKFLFPVLATLVLFAACKEKQDPVCPTVSAELVPLVVKDSVEAHYPGIPVEVWYQVNTDEFCAKLPEPPNTIFAHFGADGTFKEAETVGPDGKEIDSDNQQHENHNGEDTCECI
ncbi:MAG: hypothetical protein R3A50_14360 [Saprospiraceae bacterium]